MTMNRTILLGICLLALPARAQLAKDVFNAMPDSMSLLLTSVNRADFIDFLESKMKARVTNRFDGKSEMTVLTPDYIHIRMTPQSTWEMKLLPLADSTKVVCAVSTACAPACDSRIRFYTTDWKELPADGFLPTVPATDDFIGAAPDTSGIYAYREARRQADILFLKASLSPADTALTFTFCTPDYMEKEAAKRLEPFVRPPVVYVWKEGRFSAPAY